MAEKALNFRIRHAVKFLPLFLVVLAVSCSREGITDSPDDNLPPAVPSGVRIFSAHDGAAGIEWDKDPASNIKGYNIYRSVNTSGSLKKIKVVNEPYCIDFPLEYDSTYYYSVTAVNSNNLESGFSEIVNAKPVNQYSPRAIYDISINGRNNGSSRFIRLQWTPQQDYDIEKYEIYRDTTPEVKIAPGYLAGSSASNEFIDYNTDILQKYYYKIISVDKGGLKSDSSHTVSDLILDSPELIFPADNSEAVNLYQLQFKAASVKCRYKILIQSNELYGTVAEYDFDSDKTNEIISFEITSIPFISHRKYFWRVVTYTNSSNEPNSYSELYDFTYIAE